MWISTSPIPGAGHFRQSLDQMRPVLFLGIKECVPGRPAGRIAVALSDARATRGSRAPLVPLPFSRQHRLRMVRNGPQWPATPASGRWPARTFASTIAQTGPANTLAARAQRDGEASLHPSRVSDRDRTPGPTSQGEAGFSGIVVMRLDGFARVFHEIFAQQAQLLRTSGVAVMMSQSMESAWITLNNSRGLAQINSIPGCW